MKFVKFIAHFIGPFLDVLVKPFAKAPKVDQDEARNNPFAMPIEAKGYIKIFTDPAVKIIEWKSGILPDDYLDLAVWCKINGYEILPLTNIIVGDRDGAGKSRIAIAPIGNKIVETFLQNVNGVNIYPNWLAADMGKQFSMLHKLLGPGVPFPFPLKVLVLKGEGNGEVSVSPHLGLKLGDKLTWTIKASAHVMKNLGYDIVIHESDNKLNLSPEQLGRTIARAPSLNASNRLKRGTKTKFLSQIVENKEVQGISLEKERLAWETGILDGELLKIIGTYPSKGKRVWNRLGIMSLLGIPMSHKSVFNQFKEVLSGWIFGKLQPVDNNRTFGVGLSDDILSETERTKMEKMVVTFFPLCVRIACKAKTKVANFIESRLWKRLGDNDGDPTATEKLNPANLPLLDIDKDEDKIIEALKLPDKEPMPAVKDRNHGIVVMLTQRLACGATFNELIVMFVAAILAGVDGLTCILAYIRGHSEFVEAFIHGFKWKGGDRVRCARELLHIFKLKGESLVWWARILMNTLKAWDLHEMIDVAKRCNPNSKAVVERILVRFKGWKNPKLIEDKYVSIRHSKILSISFVRFVERDKDGLIIRQYLADRYRWIKQSIKDESAQNIVRNCLIRSDMRFAKFLIRIYKLQVPNPDIYFQKKEVIA